MGSPALVCSDRCIDSTNELVYYSVPDADVDDIDRAITAARQAFDEGPWPRLSHAERAQVLLDIADAVEARIDDIVEIWPRETGILASSVPGVMREVIDAYRYYAGLAKSFPFQEEVTPTNGARFGMIVKEPVGVVGAIIPWNAPMGLIAFKVAPALLAGCTVVIKSSPEAPGAGYIMAEIADQLGIPAGVLNVVTADRAASERLVSDLGSTRSRSPDQRKSANESGASSVVELHGLRWSSAASLLPLSWTTSTLPRRHTPSLLRSASSRVRSAHRSPGSSFRRNVTMRWSRRWQTNSTGW